MDGIGKLIEEGLVDRRIILEILPFEFLWGKMRPWMMHVREKMQSPTLYHSFERAASEQAGRLGTT
jgi:hypothetical protein